MDNKCVWVVIGHDEHMDGTLGIFSTEEKGNNFITKYKDRHKRKFKEYEVVKFIVDKGEL